MALSSSIAGIGSSRASRRRGPVCTMASVVFGNIQEPDQG